MRFGSCVRRDDLLDEAREERPSEGTGRVEEDDDDGGRGRRRGCRSSSSSEYETRPARETTRVRPSLEEADLGKRCGSHLALWLGRENEVSVGSRREARSDVRPRARGPLQCPFQILHCAFEKEERRLHMGFTECEIQMEGHVRKKRRGWGKEGKRSKKWKSGIVRRRVPMGPNVDP